MELLHAILQKYRAFFAPQIDRIMDLTYKLHSARSQLAKLERLVEKRLYPADIQVKAPKVQYFVEFLKAHLEVADTQINAYTAFKDEEMQCRISNFKTEIK